MADTSLQPATEVHVMPTYGLARPDAEVVTLEKRGGRWWHFVGGKPRREALFIETILPLSPSAWMKLAVREGWWHRA